MYEVRQQVCLLFKNSTEKIYAKSTASVTISVTESIPDPSAQDITTTPNSTGGDDIEIKLNVTGEPTLQPQTVEKEIDINRNPSASDQVKEWSGGDRITPTFNIDGTVIINWKETELRKVLTEKGYI